MEEEIKTAAEEPKEAPKKAKKKKFGPVKTSICIVSGAAVAALGVWAGIAFGRPQKRNEVDAGYGSVSYEVMEGERFSASSFVSEIKERNENGEGVTQDSGTYDAVDVFGRLNWMFAQQDNWASEMHSTVNTAVGLQDVATYKRYADGILISSDITTSSMVNLAREFCYVGDRVMWRESEESKSQWDGINTVFSSDAPSGNMNISGDDGFRKMNGLPATELSVYVIEGNTVESAELNTTSMLADGDEVFTLTMHLLAKTDEEGKTGAAAYYGNQMVFTGGIDAPPDFKYITLSYTFTEDWQVLSCNVAEEYTASMKTIVSTCSSTSETIYTYDVEGLEEEVGAVFDSYYKQYAEKEATGVVERALTAADCLASAFGSVLSGPTTLDLDLTVNGTQIPAKLYLDLGGFSIGGEFDLSKLEARLKVGDVLNLYLEDGRAYVKYSDVRISMSVDELMAMFSVPQAAAEEEAEEADILGELMGGAFTYDDASARLNSEIDLMGIPLTLDFSFDVDSNRNVTLHEAVAKASFDGVSLDAKVRFGETAPDGLGAAEKASYTDATVYVGMVKDLLAADALRAEIDYSNEEIGLSLDGNVSIAYKDGFTLKGDFTLGYGGAEKPVSVLFDGTAVYLDVDGVKVKAELTELETLLSFLPATTAETAEAEETDVLSAVLDVLLDTKFAGLLSSAGTENALSLTVKGTELLQYFGVEYGLGEVSVALTEDGLTLTVLGATLSVEGGSSFEVVTDDYVEVAGAVKQLAELFQSERIALGVTYTSDKFGINGTLTIEPSTSAVHGTFTLTIDTVERKLELDVLSGVVYVRIDDVKLKGDTAQVVALVKDILAETGTVTPDVTIPDMGDSDKDVTAILVKLLGLTFGDYLTLEEGDGVLNAVLKGTDLLRDLGITLNIGDLDLTVSEEGITAAGQGVTLTVQAGEELPAVNVSEYTDLGAVIETASAIVSAQGIALGGDLQITASGTPVALYIENGGISWKDGFKARFDVVFAVDGYHHKLEVYADEKEVTVAYGTVGVKVVFADFGTIKEAFAALKTQVQDMIDGVTGKTEALPEEAAATLALAEGGEKLSSFLTQLEGILAKLGISTDGQIDLNAILSKISLFRPATDGGLLGINIAGLSVELTKGKEGEEGLALTLKYEDSFSILGELTAAALTSPLKEMPAIDYLSTNEFVEAIGYLGAAVGLLTAQDYTFTLTGSTTFDVTEPDPEPTPDPSVPAETAIVTKTKYGFEASIKYHNGAEVPVHLDVDNQNFWIETSLFLNVHLELVAGEGAAETDKSLYLDVLIVDGAPAKDGEGQLVTDGYLDIYLSLSQFASTDPKYSPLNIYAPADEIMTILSSAVPILSGMAEDLELDLSLLDSYLVKPWLSLETVVQLEAFSGVVGGLLEGLLPQEPEEEPVPEAAALAEEGRNFKNYIKKLSVSGKELNLTLNSADVYDGVEGLEDLAVTITKNEDGKLGGISFHNVYDAAGKENTNLEGTFNYEAVTPDVPAEAAKYTSFLGAEKLLLSLVKSATHVTNAEEVISGEQTPHTYAVNNNFYIDGSVTANMFGVVDVTIDIVAVSVTIDENGILGINLRLQYEGKAVLLIPAINGTSTVDITIKNGMVYMRRVQTTKQGPVRNEEIDPITLYRAMPMANFAGDMLNQLSFILNFGDLINNAIKDGSAGDKTPTDPKPEEVVDYGKKLSDVLTSYSFTEDANGSKWDLKINGSTFSNGILGNMHVTIAADADGYIRSIELPQNDMMEIKIPAGSITLTLKAYAKFNWRNPGGVMEEGKTDLTHDVSDEIGDMNHGMGAMIEKLNAENGWTKTQDDGTVTYQFLEGKETTVAYKYRTYDGGMETLGDPQNIMVSTGTDGYPENTLYSKLLYPELPDDGKEFYVEGMPEAKVGEVIPSELVAQQYKHLYTVTFWAEEDIDGTWSFDEGRQLYKKTFDMEYGAKITFMAKGEEIAESGYTVTNDNAQEVTLPAKPAYAEGQDVASSWTVNFNQTGTEFTVLYELDTVTYTSAVTFKVEDNANNYNTYSEQFTDDTHTLLTPTAEGYTFLGWYRKTESGWEKVESVTKGAEPVTTEVEALWASTNYDFTMSGSRRNDGKLFSPDYTYTVSISTKTEEKLVGAFADEGLTQSVKCEFYIGTGTTPVYEETDGTEFSKNMGTTGSGVNVYVKVTVTYTDANGNELLSIVVEHNGTYDWRGNLS